MKKIKLVAEVECTNDYETSDIVNKIRKDFLDPKVRSSTINYQETVVNYNESFEEE